MSRCWTELFFGLTTRNGVLIPEEQWLTFLDKDILPCFPHGLTVLNADGRWEDLNHVIHAEPSRVVIILYQADHSTDIDKNIATLAEKYIKRFDQESVLRGDSKENSTLYTVDNPNSFRKPIPLGSHVIQLK